MGLTHQSGTSWKKASVWRQHRSKASRNGISICIPHTLSRHATSMWKPAPLAKRLKSSLVNLRETSTKTRSPRLCNKNRGKIMSTLTELELTYKR
jgi:hypothetical protein